MVATGRRGIGKVNTKAGRRVTTQLPKVYLDFNKAYPKISKAYTSLGDSCNSTGPLDKKTLRLAKLGIAIGTNSEGTVRSHTRRALEEGISPAEIRHVVLLALTTAGFHIMIAAYKWVEEILQDTR